MNGSCFLLTNNLVLFPALEGRLLYQHHIDPQYWAVAWGTTDKYNFYRVDTSESDACDLAIHEKAFGSRLGRIVAADDVNCEVHWYGGQRTRHNLPDIDGLALDLKFAEAVDYPKEMLEWAPSSSTNSQQEHTIIPLDHVEMLDEGQEHLPLLPSQHRSANAQESNRNMARLSLHKYWINFCRRDFDNLETPPTLISMPSRSSCSLLPRAVVLIPLLFLMVVGVVALIASDRCHNLNASQCSMAIFLAVCMIVMAAALTLIAVVWLSVKDARPLPLATFRLWCCSGSRRCVFTRKGRCVGLTIVVIFVVGIVLILANNSEFLSS